MLSNELTEALSNFRVPGHRRLLTAVRVTVDVMSAAMPFEIASGPDELTNELDPFHATSTEISLLFIPDRLTVSVSSIIS